MKVIPLIILKTIVFIIFSVIIHIITIHINPGKLYIEIIKLGKTLVLEFFSGLLNFLDQI